MEEHCLVMCGDWTCLDDGRWEFTIDKSKMSKVVTIREDMNIEELKNGVVGEFFGLRPSGVTASLSYWPPNSTELATGITTPPVLLTNAEGISFFFKHYRVERTVNLFVTFTDGERTSVSMGYNTPTPSLKRVFDEGSGSAGDSVRRSGSVRSFSSLGSGFETPIQGRKKQCPSSSFDTPAGYVSGHQNVRFDTPGSSGGIPIQFVEDEFIDEVERMEQYFPDKTPYASEENDPDDCLGDLADDNVDVRPVSFDTEFWVPFVQDVYGGSNAVDVMCPPSDGFNGKAAAMGKHKEYLCTSNDAFDHTIVSGDYESKDFKTETPAKNGASYEPQPPFIPCQRPTVPLGEIDDEEFDIPPLFDDTTYDNDDIPDLDIDEAACRIEVGRLFSSKEECQIALAIYAIKGMFQFKQTTTKRHYFILSCPDSRCDWRIRAREVGDCGMYEIQRAQLNHSCSIDTRNAYKKRASSRVIAAVFKAKYGDPEKGPRAAELQRMVLEDLRVNASYMKCYRAKEKATIEVRGTEEESYLKLPTYLHMLKLANPGTVADLEIDVDEEGHKRFMYVFLAFGASIRGFRKLRPVVSIDGTHLWGKYKGVLLTAVGQDANCQLFPLAYAVVDAEDEESWTWFLKKLEKILADSPTLTIVSNRHPAIYPAMKVAYPRAVHVACIVHLARNVGSTFVNKGLAKLVKLAAYAYRVKTFNMIFDKIRSTSSECARYLEKAGMGHWTRVYCKGERYNMMTSNACEQLNKALKEGRGCPIVELLQFIQSMMTRWFSCRRKKSLKCRGGVTPEVEKQIMIHRTEVVGSSVNLVSNWTCQVVGQFGERNLVQLKERKCSCKKFDRLKIPCGHALLAGDSLGLLPSSLSGHVFKPDAWQETYSDIICPEGDPKDEVIPEDVGELLIMPPRNRRGLGRRKVARIPSKGEFPATKVKKAVPNRCTRCHYEGHNRTTCKKDI
ncbi:unnamed protein product [Microthlaspi erraticum]|uniref:SWIM-type domain-containing protein n=1 Tax=Microthlaspi erraticum TaxID=1685480 RepID=A0A6D2JZC3_9BRAS|nr:unnamed protein product [Microthlaspi erraticum]